MTKTTTVERFVDESGEQPVRGFLHRPAEPSGDGLVLTHGAGANCASPLLVALADLFSTTGITVLRCDLPFRQLRPHGPPSPGSARNNQVGLRIAVGVLRQLVLGRVFLGGHSYGGRQATILASSEPGLADGLLLLSYPLHPPRKPSELRTGHFPVLFTPALFVHGSRDSFGSVEEMKSALKLIPAPTRLMPVSGEGHSLLSNRSRDELPNMILEEFQKFFS